MSNDGSRRRNDCRNIQACVYLQYIIEGIPMFRILLDVLFVVTSACASNVSNNPFQVEALAEFDEPWAMAFLPDGRLLITEMKRR